MNTKSLFDSLSITDIHEFVENHATEDLYLDFKTANFPISVDFDDKNFSKCLSGFANSSGGIIVWGISASKNKAGIDAAHGRKPIKELLKFENHLKRMEGRAVVPIVEGVEYRRIEESKDEGYLLVFIPQSERAPHMALLSDKHYLKRSGDSFYTCEHFDILDMINRKISPKLEVELSHEILEEHEFKGIVNHKYYASIIINNIGQVSAKYIMLQIKVSNPFQVSDYGLDGNRNHGMTLIHSKDNYKKYVGGSNIVLHPGTNIEVDRVVLNEISMTSQISDLNLEYKVIAEGMKLKCGEISVTKEQLLKAHGLEY